MRNGDFTIVIVAILLLTAIGVGSVLYIGAHKLAMDSSWVMILGLIPTTIASLLAFLKSFQNGAAIKEVHMIMNSRLTELLAKTAENATLVERAANEGVKPP